MRSTPSARDGLPPGARGVHRRHRHRAADHAPHVAARSASGPCRRRKARRGRTSRWPSARASAAGRAARRGNAAPGPPHAHFTDPPHAMSHPQSASFSGTVPADWYTSSKTIAPTACARSMTARASYIPLDRKSTWLMGTMQRALVDRGEQLLDGRVDAVLALDDDDIGATPALPLPYVVDGREVQVVVDHLVALPLEGEARGDDGLRDRHVGQHAHGARRDAEHARRRGPRANGWPAASAGPTRRSSRSPTRR